MAFGLFGRKKPTAGELPLPPPPKPPEAKPNGFELPLAPPELDLPAMPESMQPLPPEQPPAMAAPPAPAPRPAALPAPAERPARPEPEERIRMAAKPLFVSVEEYHAIIGSAETVRNRLMEAENLMRKLTELRNLEEKEFERWRQSLEDVEKKLAYVDKIVAKAQG